MNYTKMLDKSTTALSLVFVVVGMMFLVPVITGEALGITNASVKAYTGHILPAGGLDPVFVSKDIDEGSWSLNLIVCQIIEPECSWKTEGSPAPGPEAADVVYAHHEHSGHHSQVAKFSWYNPRSGANTCGTNILEKWGFTRVDASCHIAPGSSASVKYTVDT